MTKSVCLRDFPKSLLHNAPIPIAGKEKPPIIKAINFAMGMRISAGRKMIACAFGAKSEAVIKIITTDNAHLIYNIKYT
jgi:hypothetical protein